VAELKASKSNAGSNSKPKLDKGADKEKKINYVEPSATVATTKIQKIDLEDLEEGERLFNS